MQAQNDSLFLKFHQRKKQPLKKRMNKESLLKIEKSFNENFAESFQFIDIISFSNIDTVFKIFDQNRCEYYSLRVNKL